MTKWDWLCDITMLQYFEIGGFFFEWFLSAILILYILFPFIYLITNKFTFVIVSFICICIIHYVNPRWQFDCLISRMPVFLLGIIIYKKQLQLKTCLLMTLLLSLLSIVFYKYNMRFLFSASFCPIIMITVHYCIKLFSKIKLESLIEYIGVNSINIYIANGFTLYTTKIIQADSILYYILFQVFYSIINIFIFKKTLSPIIIRYENSLFNK